jgi:ATP-dependent helicase/nuclease subunit B
LRRYLACPFRFYLRHVLRMDTVDPLKSELDAFDFGTLCHAALERIGLEPALRDCTEPAVLRRELLGRLDAAVQERYGKLLSLPLLIQVESARQRLGRLAELQAAERAAGWEIIHVERAFEVDVAGLIVRGKIDRIDRHAATGAVRVLDYKTSDTPVTPAQAHLRPVRAGEALPPWARVELAGREFAWVDLQLPLYLRAMGPEFAGWLACGYFNLPKAAGETVLACWDDYTPELHAAAMRCTEGACAAIRRGEFWPPNEAIDPDRDECAALFHHGVEESVSWAGASPQAGGAAR